jgi:hypothetical protein
MNHSPIQRLFSVISGLWVGGFIAVGFLVVPILFMTIGDRQVASMIAANLFKSTAYISVAILGFLMVMANHLLKLGKSQYRSIRWILLLMLACAISAAFIIIPWMNALRDRAFQLGISVWDSGGASTFGLLHHFSSAIYVIQSILGVGLVWQATKNVD